MFLKNKVLAFTIICLAVFVSFALKVNAMTEIEKQALISQIQQQIATLMQQVVQMQTQSGSAPVGQTSTGSALAGDSCHDFNVNMKIGDFGTEVAYLQKMLAREGYSISYQESSTSSFGKSTESAVLFFQKKYASDILTPLNLKNGTGIVSVRTRVKLNSLYGCTPVGTIPSSSTNYNASTITTPTYVANPTPYAAIGVTVPKTAIKENTSIVMPASSLDGLTISGTINLASEEGIVRAVLVDVNGKEYLVFEANISSYEKGKDIQFSKLCEETCVFVTPVTPSKLKIKVSNASVTIGSLDSVATVSAGGQGTAKYTAAFSSAKVTTLSKVKETIQKNNLGWTAGETSVSDLTYSQKKRLLNIPEDQDLPNLKGFEYYAGGIFSDEPETASMQKSVSYSASFSSIPDVVDYRNFNGKNYMTPVKSQGQWGNCFAFAYAGAMEAQININAGRNLGLNLSEQQIVDCVYGYKLNGNKEEKIMSEALNFYSGSKKLGAFTGTGLTGVGLTDEACDPYDSRDFRDAQGRITGEACDTAHICSDWRERVWMPSDSEYVDSTEDALRTALATKGVIVTGIKDLTPLGQTGSGLGHAMVLMGYSKSGNYWIFKNSWGSNWGEGGYIKIKTPVSNIGSTNIGTYVLKGPFTPPANSAFAPTNTQCIFKQKCDNPGKSPTFTVTDLNCKTTKMTCADAGSSLNCYDDTKNYGRVICKCQSYFECSEWSACSNGIKTRKCEKRNADCAGEAEETKKESKACSITDPTCVPKCAGKKCGDDNGCDGLCQGVCPNGTKCQSGICLPGECSQNSDCGFSMQRIYDNKSTDQTRVDYFKFSCSGQGTRTRAFEHVICQNPGSASSKCFRPLGDPYFSTYEDCPSDKPCGNGWCGGGLKNERCSQDSDCGINKCEVSKLWDRIYYATTEKFTCINAGTDQAECVQMVKEVSSEKAGNAVCQKDENPQVVNPSCVPSCTGKLCGADDGCKGKCQGSCPSGQTCQSGVCTTGQTACTPKTCAQLGKTCGTVDDGCGKTLDCGTCPVVPTIKCSKDADCGASGFTGSATCKGNDVYQNYTLNKCLNPGTTQSSCSVSTSSKLKEACIAGCSNGSCNSFLTPPVCTAKTCSQLGKACGETDDGCGRTLYCGACQYGQTCMAGVCTDNGSVCAGKECGIFASTYGSVTCSMSMSNPLWSSNFSAGFCPLGYACSDEGKCIDPKTACQPGICGSVLIGANTMAPTSYDCGSCPTETLCDSRGTCGIVKHDCVASKCRKEWYCRDFSPCPMLDCTTCVSPIQCTGLACALNPTNNCTPKTCSQLGKTCGTADDGCGRSINCGGCQYGETCNNGTCTSYSNAICTGKECGIFALPIGGSVTCSMSMSNPLWSSNFSAGFCPLGYACSDEGKCIDRNTLCQPGSCDTILVGGNTMAPTSVYCGSCPTETLCDRAGRCGTVGHQCVANKCQKEWFCKEYTCPSIDCKTCATEAQCAGLSCVSTSLGGCTAKTCSQLGKTCGTWDDGCGGLVNCGTRCATMFNILK